MNTADILKSALTPGSPFNRNALVWRSRSSLAQIAGIPENEVSEILLGDLAQGVTCRASKKPGVGMLVALTEHIPPPEEEDDAAPPPEGPVQPPIEVEAGEVVEVLIQPDVIDAFGVADVQPVDEDNDAQDEPGEAAAALEAADAGLDPE